MNIILGLALAFSCVGIVLGEGLKCSTEKAHVPTEWIDMVESCKKHLKSQVQTEVNAAINYLSMGAYFSYDGVNRPGFSKFFFEAANEERQHAIKVLEYLLMRGQLKKDIEDLIQYPLRPDKEEWGSGNDALKKALELETSVTASIRKILQVCEKDHNDYHLVDYFTADFMDEQLKGERDLAGKISTLGKMMYENGAIGEFLFDKQLLK